QISTSSPDFDERVILWCRFIDDIFVIWKGNETSARDFVAFLNNNYNLHLSDQSSKQQIAFPDVEVIVQ
ncbi:hypothetical protein NDU88_006485, partial [Pleurodeles waltl]